MTVPTVPTDDTGIGKWNICTQAWQFQRREPSPNPTLPAWHWNSQEHPPYLLEMSYFQVSQ